MKNSCWLRRRISRSAFVVVAEGGTCVGDRHRPHILVDRCWIHCGCSPSLAGAPLIGARGAPVHGYLTGRPSAYCSPASRLLRSLNEGDVEVLANFRARRSSISTCRGTAERLFDDGLCHQECRPPSRNNAQPCLRRCRRSFRRFIQRRLLLHSLARRPRWPRCDSAPALPATSHGEFPATPLSCAPGN